MDDIRNELKRQQPDSTRAYLLMKLANRSEPGDSAITGYLTEALFLARKTQKKILTARIYIATGSWHFENQRYDKSAAAYQQALQTLGNDRSREATILKAQVSMNQGGQSYRLGRPNEAIDAYYRVIPQLEAIHDTFTLATAYEHLGKLFFNQLAYAKAALYFGKSIAVDGNAPRSSQGLASKYVSMAFCMLSLDSMAKAKQYLEQARIRMESVGDPLPEWGKYYYILGQLQQSKGRQQAALQSYLKGHAVARRFNDQYLTGDLLEVEALLYKEMGRYKEALNAVIQLKTLSAKVPEVPFNLNALRLLADLEFNTNNPGEAYRHLKAYIELADSQQRNKVTERMHELEAQYQSAQKERRIAQLQRDNERKGFVLKRHRLLLWLLTVAAVALLLLALLATLFYRRGRKLLVQEKRVHELELDKVNQQHSIAVLSAMLEGQEQERIRLARDLHDGMGSLLSGAKIELSVSAAPREVLVAQTMKHLDHAVDELRRIARSMMPEVLLTYGLGEATLEYCNALRKTGAPLACQVYHYKNDMSHGRQVTLYRIMQELVNNAIKHAAATQILVQLQQRGDCIFLTVEDNGKGWDTGSQEQLKGAGLSNITARAELLQARMETGSTPGVGTTVTIECPVI